jgi:hypothetical protein
MSEPTNPRTVLVPATSAILNDPRTETLHIYENGETLIRTTALNPDSVDRADDTDTTIVNAGLCLPDETLFKRPESAGHALDNFADHDIINAYIELIGPVDRRWLETLNQLAIDLLQFRPEHSFLSRGTVKAFRQALDQPFVVDVLPVDATTKPQPTVPESGEQEVWIIVQSPIELAANIIKELAALPEVTIDPDQAIDQVDFYLRLRATVSAQGQAVLLQHPKVLAVEPYSPIEPEDEVAGLILAGQYDSAGRPQGSYLRWLEDHGLNGEGVTIGIVDAGVDITHPGFAGRIKDLNPERRSWHGTFVAGHAAGCYLAEKDGNQFIYGLGMAPKADLLIQDNQSTPTALCQQTVTEVGLSGKAGTVQNNSWGAGTKNPMDYGSQEATYDRLVRNADPDRPVAKPLTICFSAGNSGANGLTRPKAAKNIIVTGNSENYRPGIGKDQSDNISEVYTGPRGSSHGNCGDGRIVPHLVAPGEWTASANYDSHEGDKEYISPKLTWGSGTSAASPKTAGACALLIQWWRLHNYNQDPSPALLKAMLVNGAEPMPIAGFIPNKLQGWGRLNLENVLRQDIRRTYVDQTIKLNQRGDQQTWKVRAANPSLPVKITLCWTDPAGALGTGTSTASAIVNKIALRAEHNGQIYRGNQFNNGWSIGDTGQNREGWDNLQNIFLAPGIVTGALQITVTALEITTNCLTGKIDIPQQDFALVISNGTIDHGSSAIFVAVDPNINRAPSPLPGSYWADGHQDSQESNHEWWQSIDDTRQNQSPPVKSPPVKSPLNQQQVDAWWLQDDIAWSKPEGDRDQTIPSPIVKSLQAGIAVVTAAQSHQIVLANKTNLETSRDHDELLVVLNETGKAIAETSRDLTPLLQSSASLSESLTQLMQNWTQFGALVQTGQVAVLLVGSGTRVTGADILAMRRLTQIGQLYLVSNDAQLLSFLAQRVHCRWPMICRLANSASSLPNLLRDTLVEASGGQQLAVSKTTQIVADHHHTFCTFDVTSLDRHLTIRLQFPPGLAPQAMLHPAGQAAINLTSNLTSNMAIPGIQTISGEDFLQFDCASIAVGSWKLLLRQPSVENAIPEDTYRVRVWAWGDLSIDVTPKVVSAIEAPPSQFELMLTVSSSNSTTFKRIQGEPRLMYEIADLTSIQAESDRSIAVTATASRTGQRSLSNESSRETQAAELSTVLSLTKPPAGSVVIDVPLWVEGRDPQGHPFTRLVRHSLIDLEPRSQWRSRLQSASLAAAIIPLLTPAKIIAVERSGQEIVGLRLQKGDRQRSVVVTSALLRRQLEWLSLSREWASEWLVGLLGNELYGLHRTLK